jgi:hypothetical protein
LIIIFKNLGRSVGLIYRNRSNVKNLKLEFSDLVAVSRQEPLFNWFSLAKVQCYGLYFLPTDGYNSSFILST